MNIVTIVYLSFYHFLQLFCSKILCEKGRFNKMFSNTIMFKVYTNTTLFPMRLIWDINYLKRIGLSYTILMFIFYLLVLAIKLHQDCTNIHLHTLASYPYPHFSHNYTKEWVKERHARMVNVTFPNSHRLLVVSLRRIWPLIPLFKCTAKDYSGIRILYLFFIFLMNMFIVQFNNIHTHPLKIMFITT